ncbi:MAG: PilZ domain-containing protein [Candidatus Dadabacteria bacterium]|nr:PilZ domain-containing protein [Candidatus Dadabacteria bacterium]
MREKRGSRRIPFRKNVKYGTNKNMTTGYTFDLSETGLGLRGKRVLPPKTRISLSIQLADTMISLDGVVVHAKRTIPGQPSVMGVRLLQCPAVLKAVYMRRAGY